MSRTSSFEKSIVITAALTAEVAFACSGQGAARAMAVADIVGFGLWLATLVLAVFVLRSPRGRGKWLVALPVVIHPGLWLSSAIGDCGRMRIQASIAVSITAVLLATWLLRRRAPRP